MSSVWNPDNVRDVAESVGIASLADNVVEELARDVDFRLAQVLEEALKFMRHGKRTTLSTQDVSNALKVLNVEPLYGYESTRPLRFGEASLGPGQPLYYVEDEEVDFEKLINAPLPKVPREITFTGMSLHLLSYLKCFVSDVMQLTGLPWKAYNHRYLRTQLRSIKETCCPRGRTRTRISQQPTDWTMSTSSRL